MTTVPLAPTRPSQPPPGLPPRARPGGQAQTPPLARSAVAFVTLEDKRGESVIVYGPGGIGKTTAACMAPGPVAFFDLDNSLSILRKQLPEAVSKQLHRVGGVTGWQSIRDALHAPGWDAIKTIVIDSATKAEEMATEWTLANVPHEKGHRVNRLEDYGYGKGLSHVYDTFMPLLSDLEQHMRAGRHVILICHDCTANVPNPHGEDWIRYEPRLQSPASGKSSLRLRVREWTDHMLFVGYDVNVKDGVGTGSGTRTIYPCELPHCMAKSRTLADTLPLVKFDTALWKLLLGDNHVA